MPSWSFEGAPEVQSIIIVAQDEFVLYKNYTRSAGSVVLDVTCIVYFGAQGIQWQEIAPVLYMVRHNGGGNNETNRSRDVH